jgi:hypothetical protein
MIFGYKLDNLCICSNPIILPSALSILRSFRRSRMHVVRLCTKVEYFLADGFILLLLFRPVPVLFFQPHQLVREFLSTSDAFWMLLTSLSTLAHQQSLHDSGALKDDEYASTCAWLRFEGPSKERYASRKPHVIDDR